MNSDMAVPMVGIPGSENENTVHNSFTIMNRYGLSVIYI